jgi:hypothetical protein
MFVINGINWIWSFVRKQSLIHQINTLLKIFTAKIIFIEGKLLKINYIFINSQINT